MKNATYFAYNGLPWGYRPVIYIWKISPGADVKL